MPDEREEKLHVALGDARNGKLYIDRSEARFLVGDTWYDVTLLDGALQEIIASVRRHSEKRRRHRDLDFGRLHDERDSALRLASEALGISEQAAYRLARLGTPWPPMERDDGDA